MAEPYLTDLKAIVDCGGLLRPETVDVTCKHFFGGAAAYVDGKIFMSLTPVGLALKLPPADRERLFAEGGKPLQYFPKAPVKKDYVLLSDDFTGDADRLSRWFKKSIAFARG